MNALENMGIKAGAAAAALGKLSKKKIDDALVFIAAELEKNAAEILGANEKDVKNAEERGVKASLIDRLRLSEKRIEDIAEGLRQVAELPSPLGEVVYSYRKENGLEIEEKRVPFGVIGIIFESRPNVAADAFGLCFKTANAVILRGGSDAICSNIAIVGAIRRALAKCGADENAVQLIEDTSRETARDFMRLDKYVDLLIPRGGAGLIRTVTENSSVPVIETGTGNCHVYIDESADAKMAADIVYNAKTQRYGVCNACESIVVHEKAAARVLPAVAARLKEKNVEIRADERARKVLATARPPRRRTTARNISTRSFPSRRWIRSKRRSRTSTDTIRDTARPSLRKAPKTPEDLWTAWTPPLCTGTPPPALRTVLSSGWGRRSASARRNCTRAVRWASRRSPLQNFTARERDRRDENIR